MNELRFRGRYAVALAVILVAFVSGMGQSASPPQGSPQMPKQQPTIATSPGEANPTDVNSIDAIIAAVYDVISGPAGKKRDWGRMKSLFAPGARLIPTSARADGSYGARALTVDEYIERSSPFFEKEGFYETETARVTEQFGRIAHAFSTYDSRHAPGDAKPFARGINSIQLMNDGKRWWIVTIFWQGEDEKHPLPKKYLKKPISPISKRD